MKLKILLLTMGLFLITSIAGAAGSSGTCSFAPSDGSRNSQHKTLTFTWVGDDATGSVPTTQCGMRIDGYIVRAVTDPGVAPTDNYNIVVRDDDSVDVMGGAWENRDSIEGEQVLGKIDGTPSAVRVDSKLTFTLTDQTNAGATGIAKLYIVQTP